MPGSNVYISSGGATGGAATTAATTAATNTSSAASNAATATGSAGAGVMPYIGAGVGLLNTINTAINNAQISDTQGYRDYYDAFGSQLYDGDFNALVNQRKNSYLKAAPTWRQIRGMTTGQKTASHISSAASGAMAGAGFGVPGALIGASLGFLGSFLGAEAGDAKAKEEAANLRIRRKEALADNQAAFVQGMRNASSVANHQAMANLTAFGGMLDTIDPATPIGYSLYADDYVRKQNKVNNSSTGNTLFSGMPNNAFAFGGGIYTKGANFEYPQDNTRVVGSIVLPIERQQNFSDEQYFWNAGKEYPAGLWKHKDGTFHTTGAYGKDIQLTQEEADAIIRNNMLLERQEKLKRAMRGKQYANGGYIVGNTYDVDEQEADRLRSLGYEFTIIE